MASHSTLQYLLPWVAIQLQGGCAHFLPCTAISPPFYKFPIDANSAFEKNKCVQPAVPYSDDPKTDSHETPAALKPASTLLLNRNHLFDETSMNARSHLRLVTHSLRKA